MTDADVKFLDVKSNGDAVVDVNSDTLGLKSRTSLALTFLLPILGISLEYLSES